MADRGHVLQRIDEWYSNRIRKNYTQEFEEELIKDIDSELEQNLPNFKDKSYSLKHCFSLGHLVNLAKNYFTFAYNVINSLDEMSSRSSGMFQEYYLPMIEPIFPIKAFVENVREKASKVFPDKLEDKLIEESFKEIFRNENDFANIALKSLQNAKPAVDIYNKNKYNPKEIDKLMEFSGKIILAMHKKIFEDLYKANSQTQHHS